MKLAEALILRAEYREKIQNYQERIVMNLKVQENEEPHEDPNVLYVETMRLNDELCSLTKKINEKNNNTKLENGQTVSEALVDRNNLMGKRQFLKLMAAHAGSRDFRLTRAEVKMYITIDVREIQKEIDSLSQQFRLIDTQIQGSNWVVDLE